jgi:Na+-translocating ferredoxin:NAD+ oxidoreductase RnfC subunit
MKQSIVDLVRQGGVIGAGGAGFPTYIKMSGSYECVIANGAECEPLLQCDQKLMQHHASRIIHGLELALEATSAKYGIVALKSKHINAIPAIQKAIDQSNANISLFKLGSYYPAGDEQVLVYEVLGKIVPEGGRPTDIGVLVQNVQTLAHVASATEGQPVINRVISVHGEVREPKTIIVPIGAKISDILQKCGGTTISDFAIMTGGAMMGKIASNHDSSVGKTTSGIYVLPSDHPLIRMKSTPLDVTLKQAQVACEQCSFCTMFCPRFLLGHTLLPHKIMQAVGWNSEVKSADITGAYLCCECGLCGVLYACPTGLSPDRYNAELKTKLSEQRIPNPHSKKDLTVIPEREVRRVPVETLIKRLCLTDYDKPAVWDPDPLHVDEVVLSLNEHIGSPAIPCVRIGESVFEGQLIAETSEQLLGTRVHSSIEGKVIAQNNTSIKIRRNTFVN